MVCISKQQNVVLNKFCVLYALIGEGPKIARIALYPHVVALMDFAIIAISYHIGNCL